MTCLHLVAGVENTFGVDQTVSRPSRFWSIALITPAFAAGWVNCTCASGTIGAVSCRVHPHALKAKRFNAIETEKAYRLGCGLIFLLGSF